MIKPILFVDANFVIDLFGRSTFNGVAGTQAINDLSKKYDLRITSTVYKELGLDNGDVPAQYSAQYKWVADKNIPVYQTPSFTGVPDGGEKSIISVIEPGGAYHDSSLPSLNNTNDIQVASRDLTEFQAANIQGNVKSTQAVIESGLLDQTLTPDIYKSIYDNNGGSFGTSTIRTAETVVAEKLHDTGAIADVTSEGHLRINGTVVEDLSGFLKKAGAIGSVLGIALMASEANAQVNAGNYEGAAKTIAEFVGGTIGGAIVGAGVIAISAPLVAALGVGAVTGAVLVGSAAFVGSIAGDNIGANAAKEAILAAKELGLINNDIIHDYAEALLDPQAALSSLPTDVKSGLASLLSPYGGQFLSANNLTSGGVTVTTHELETATGINIDVAKFIPGNNWLKERGITYSDGSFGYLLKQNDIIINPFSGLGGFNSSNLSYQRVNITGNGNNTGISYSPSSPVIEGSSTSTIIYVTKFHSSPFLIGEGHSDEPAWQNGGAIIGNNYEGYLPSEMLNGNGYSNTIPSGIVTDFYRPGAGTLWGDFSNFMGLSPAVDTVAQGITNAGSIFLGAVTGGVVGAAIAVIANIFARSFSWINLDPVVIDIDGNGINLIQIEKSKALFDIDNDGIKESTAWVSPGDGILVRDINGDGTINNISETLSEFYNNGNYADGISALKSLDSNNDNIFTASDAAFSSLKIWQDLDGDGETDIGELKTLSSLGITSIDLLKTIETRLEINGNTIVSSTNAVINGQEHDVISVDFTANPIGYEWNVVSEGIEVVTEDNAGKILFLSNEAGSTINLSSLNVEAVQGNIGNDTLNGDNDNNWLIGGGGSDTLSGGAGNDLLIIDAQDNPSNIDAGSGFDTVQVSGAGAVSLNLNNIRAEVVIGGDGDDQLIGGGNTSVYISGGKGSDFIAGGAANDALSGEDGNDFIDGQRGNDIIRGHRGEDILYGYSGEDYLDGGENDDLLLGGADDDLLIGGKGNDTIYGGTEYDVAQYSGNYDEYEFKFLSNGSIQIKDKIAGRDGTDTLYEVEALNFKNITEIELNIQSPFTVNDVISVSGNGPYTISKSALVSNDIDFQNNTVSVSSVLSAVGGTISINGNNIIFTPDETYTGIRSFKYKIQDSDNYSGSEAYNPLTGQSAEMVGTVYLKEPGQPDDPEFFKQWYLSDANILPVWKDYTGAGVKVGVFEFGDIEGKHPDLIDNLTQETIDNSEGANLSSHPTLVSGIIAASKNSIGSVGVAYDVQLSGENLGDLSDPSTPFYLDYDLSIDTQTFLATYTPKNSFSNILNLEKYDIANNSWGSFNPFSVNFNKSEDYNAKYLDYSLPILQSVMNGRDGLGTIVIFGAGNNRDDGGNTNLSNFTNSPYTITVGAINKISDLASLEIQSAPFSTPGASILISAPGSNIASTSVLLENANGSTFGNDYEVASGTSFATPIVSGVVALMLEANSTLGYRDVQEILAYSAKSVSDVNTTWQTNKASNWNGGGLHFSHDYGFGNIDALAAVRLAETWNTQQAYSNVATAVYSGAQTNISLVDNATTLATIIVPANATGIDLEHVSIELTLTHSRLSDLIITLVSPGGTQGVILNNPDVSGTASVSGGNSSLHYTFGDVASWGENISGTWTLKIQDTVTGQTGILNDWKLKFDGNLASEDDTYIYTNEYQNLTDASRHTLADTGGDDTINTAAVSGNVVINLNEGTSSSIANTGFTIGSTSSIERVVAGDGNDTLTGNALNNFLYGGRGNDSISGGAGSDWLAGSSGNNNLTGGTGADKYIINSGDVGMHTITDFSITDDVIILSGFNGLHFKSDLTITSSGSNTQIVLPDGQVLTLVGVNSANLSDAHFLFKDNFLITDVSLSTEIYNGTLAADTNVASGSNAYIMYGKAGNDNLTGASGADIIYGDAGNDIIHGGLGSDIIYGGDNENHLYGEGGNDILHLNDGMNWAYGGTGNDTFVIHKDLSGNGDLLVFVSGIGAYFNDIIDDFDVTNEKIDISEFTQLTNISDLKLSSFNMNGVNYLRVYIDPPPINESMAGVNPANVWTIYRSEDNGKKTLYGGANHRIFAPSGSDDRARQNDGRSAA